MEQGAQSTLIHGDIKNMFYAGIQGSYKSFEIALFKDQDCIGTFKSQPGSSVKASSQFITILDQFLKKHDLTLEKLSFLAVNQGPGAFTSLRVVIASINGIVFAQDSENQTKLVGVDGLDALAKEAREKGIGEPEGLLIPLLNAYNNEVYYGIYKISADGKKIDLIENKGYKKVELIFENLKQNFKDKNIFFVGNGIEIAKDLIKKDFYEKAEVFESLSVCSAEQVGKIGFSLWNEGVTVSQLKPLYLKTETFAVKK